MCALWIERGIRPQESKKSVAKVATINKGKGTKESIRLHSLFYSDSSYFFGARELACELRGP